MSAGGVSVRNTFILEMDQGVFSRLLATALASGQFANAFPQNTLSSNRKIKTFSIINCPIFFIHSFKVPCGSLVAPTAFTGGQQQDQTSRPQLGGYPTSLVFLLLYFNHNYIQFGTIFFVNFRAKLEKYR